MEVSKAFTPPASRSLVRYCHAALAAGAGGSQQQPPLPPPPRCPLRSTRRHAAGCRPCPSPPTGYAQASTALPAKTTQERRNDPRGCRHALSRRLSAAWVGLQSAPHLPAREAPTTNRLPLLFYTSRLTSRRPVSAPRLPGTNSYTNFSPPPRSFCYPATAGTSRRDCPQVLPQHMQSLTPQTAAAEALPNTLPLPSREDPVPHHDALLS